MVYSKWKKIEMVPHLHFRKSKIKNALKKFRIKIIITRLKELRYTYLAYLKKIIQPA